MTIILNYNGQQYIVDSGFGGNLPLKPVPLTGEIVTSANGEFRVEKEESKRDKYIFYMKLRNKDKDKDWKIGYAFHTKEICEDLSRVCQVQKTIEVHDSSPFNKKPLVTRLTDKGSITLTDTSFTEWIDGEEIKEDIDEERLKELVNARYGIFCLK